MSTFSDMAAAASVPLLREVHGETVTHTASRTGTATSLTCHVRELAEAAGPNRRIALTLASTGTAIARGDKITRSSLVYVVTLVELAPGHQRVEAVRAEEIN